MMLPMHEGSAKSIQPRWAPANTARHRNRLHKFSPSPALPGHLSATA
jgi:hypothetical protein